ncbi:MAG: right-handed parallel beta-helix repeat-containing protein [Phycisphaeraceae bacterium]|nr:right-handed parallel beta-helix repeat-containing protein [Phycisphaeraceae bacterium]
MLVAAMTTTSLAGDDFFLVTDQAGVSAADAGDDTAGIQTAITNNRHVHFPPGVYRINTAISIPSNTLITGSGASSIIRHYFDGAPANQTNDLFDIVGSSGANKVNITISGLRFIGNDQAIAGEGAYGIHALYADHLMIRNCQFRSFGNPTYTGQCALRAMDFRQTSKVIVDGVDIRECYAGTSANSADMSFYTSNSDLIITNNHIQTTTKCGFAITSFSTYSSNRVVVSNNTALGQGAHCYIGAYGGTNTSIVYTRNIARGSGYSGIYIPTNGDWAVNPNAGGIIVSHNLITNCGTAGETGISHGINVGGGGRPITIKGNVILNTGYDLNGNLRQLSGGYAPSAIHSHFSDKLLIADNVITTAQGPGIDLYLNEAALVHNNQLHGTDGGGVVVYNNAGSPFDYLEIIDNVIDVSHREARGITVNITAPEISEQYDGRFRIHGNRILGSSKNPANAEASMGILMYSYLSAPSSPAYPLQGEIINNSIENFYYGMRQTSGISDGLLMTSGDQVISNNIFRNIVYAMHLYADASSPTNIHRLLGQAILDNTDIPWMSYASPYHIDTAIATNPRVVLEAAALPASTSAWIAGDRVVFNIPVTVGSTKYLGAVYNGSGWTYYGPTQ